MVNFGYTTLPVHIIDLDKTNQDLANQLSIDEPSFRLCIACGSCAATCTAGKFTNFNFREMCHQIKLGDSQKAIAESEKCMMCGKCTLACPRNVNTRNVIRLIRKAKQNM